MFEVMPDGSFTETHDWIPDETTARSAVNAIANQAGIASWFIDEYTAVGNALRALKTSVSLDLYHAWWEQSRKSDLAFMSWLTHTLRFLNNL